EKESLFGRHVGWEERVKVEVLAPRLAVGDGVPADESFGPAACLGTKYLGIDDFPDLIGF
ncbi:unnamed protein product, partial [marine sediment metagenome]